MTNVPSLSPAPMLPRETGAKETRATATEPGTMPPEPIRPEALIADAQHLLACWSRAWTQVTHGMMSASMAQVELVRAIYAPAPQDWARMVHSGVSREAARDALQTIRVKWGGTLDAYRKINDELADAMFCAANSLLDGRADTPAQHGISASAADMRPASPRQVGPGV